MLQAVASLAAQALDALPAEIAIVDPSGHIVAVNERWRRFALEHGGDPTTTCDVGIDYLGALERVEGPYADCAREALDGLRDVLAGAASEFEFEYSCPTASQDLWFRLTVQRIPGPYALVVHMDETGAVEQARRFQREAEAFADEASRLREGRQSTETFAATLAHDVRGRLRAIQTLCDRIEEADAPEARPHVARIRAEVERIAGLTESATRLGRIAGADLHPEEVDLGEVARRIVATLRDREPHRRVEFTTRGNLHARCDGELVHSLLENLLTNAWRFTREKAPARIELSTIEEDGAPPVFVVRDNGVGFPAECARAIFEPARQLHDASYGGTGMGLAVARSIVERHHGQIWASGEPGRGAAILFTLAPGPRLAVHETSNSTP